jgi:putative transposase
LKVEHSGGLVPGGSDEEITIHGDADCLELKAGRQRTVGQGAVPGARHLGGDLTQLEVLNWKSKYGGMEASDLRHMKELEAENAKLKRMYADLALEHRAMKDLIEKKL